MNLPLEQSRPHFNGILLKLRFRRENRANASVTQAKGAVARVVDVASRSLLLTDMYSYISVRVFLYSGNRFDSNNRPPRLRCLVSLFIELKCNRPGFRPFPATGTS